MIRDMTLSVVATMIAVTMSLPMALNGHGLLHQQKAEQVSGYKLQLFARAQEAGRLRTTLDIENYRLSPARLRELSRVQEAGRDHKTEDPVRLLDAYDRALNELMRHDETTELRFDDEGLSMVVRPVRFRLISGIGRPVPVIVRNAGARPLMLNWRSGRSSGASGNVRVSAGSWSRFFVPLRASATQQRASIRFSVDGGEAVTSMGPLVLGASGMVRVRVLDETGKSTPARLYAQSDDGRSYFPADAIKRQTHMGEYYCYVPGEFDIRLPVGTAKLEFIKGFEYRLGTGTVEVEAGKTAELTVQLKRLTNLPAAGWFSGDGHIHMSYGGTLRMQPKEVLLMLQAEDLNAGNMVVANRFGADVEDQAHFEGVSHRLSMPRHVMRWNEEYRNNGMLGHMILYGLKELTTPLYTGFPNTPHPYDYPVNAQIAQQVLDQGGFVTGAHPFWNRNEHAIDVVLGKMGGIETLGYGALYASGEVVLHALWNCGFRTVATAGTDSFLNQVKGDPLGGARCYALVDGEFSYDSWLAGVRSGRTFVSNGPILLLEVEGQPPGSEIRKRKDAQGNVELKVHARAISLRPLTDLEILLNGKTVARAKAGEDEALVVNQTVKVSHSGWISARCSGPNNRFIMGGGLFKRHAQNAMTSPVWIVVDDQPMPPSPDSERLLNWTDTFIRKIETKGRFANEQQRRSALKIFNEARVRFQRMADQFRKLSPRK